ncbi:MAG: filamentous hemagglutinin N-terminal domain-containing protein, partial [Deltaproteobacteria bacterium]|nr:filamentous hemagglutinin N-terminal domain-containing protein [Deltaproteobacteria bacterium]
MGKRSTRAIRRRDLLRSASLARRLASWTLAALIALPAPAALAGPQDGKVVAGEATIQYGLGEVDTPVSGVDSWVLIGQDSHSAATEWSSIDTAANEGLRIQQPDATSRHLLRVRDSAATNFDGALVADGRVYIANPNGIYFGGKALVDVGALFAVAGQISNDHFMAGQDHFTGIKGQVRVDEGAQLRAVSSIALLGRQVANHGHVSAEDGLLVMAAGNEILLSQHGSPILVKLTAPADAGSMEGPAVENTGTLDAGRGRVRMAAGDLVSLAVRNTGSVRGKEIRIAGGEGGLVEVSGELDARGTQEGETGGRIEVLGDFIELKGARLDASGEAGGGDIRVGGEVRGGEGLPSAIATYVSADSELLADALGEGDGGSVVVWGDEIAQVYGSISARGGVRGGDGGFVETSGKRWLDLHPTRAPDVSAPKGEGGQWLLDPTNISIVNLETPDPSCPDPDGCDLDSQVDELRGFLPDPAVRPEQPEDSTVSVASIKRALLRGATVTLTTNTRAGGGTQEGDIYVLAEIVISEGDGILQDTVGTLELLAANDVIITKSIKSETDDVVLNLRVVANEAAQRAFDSDPLAGDVLIGVDADGTEYPIEIITQGGSAEFDGVNIRTGPAYVDSATGVLIDSGDGTTSLRAFNGKVVLDGTIKTRAGLVNIEARRTAVEGADDADISVTISETASIETGVALDSGTGDWVAGEDPGGSVVITVDGDGYGDGNVDGINIAGSVRTHGGDVVLDSQVGNETDTDLDDDGSLNSRSGIVIAALASGDPTLDTDGGGLNAVAQGQIVVLGEIDTSNDLAGGGAISLFNQAVDADGDDVEGRANVEIMAGLKSGGGDVTAVGLDVELAEGVTIEAFDPANTEEDLESVVRLTAVRDLVLTGGNTLHGDRVTLDAGVIDGVGNVYFGPRPDPDLPAAPPVTPIRLAADEFNIFAGNGVGGLDDNDENAHVVGIENASFRDATNQSGTRPEQFGLTQDAAITDDQLPEPDQFGTNDVDRLEYDLTSTQADVQISTPSKVLGSYLEISGASAPQINDVISPRSLSVFVASGWAVDSTIASRLRPKDDDEGSTLTLHAGTEGIGNLAFSEAGVELWADEITLRAGNGTDSDPEFQDAYVDVTTNAPAFRNDTGTASPEAFSVQQDADIVSRTVDEVEFWNVPTSEQLGIAQDDEKASVDLDYTIRSDDGYIEIDAHVAESVENSRLALIARGQSETVDGDEVVVTDFEFVDDTRIQVESMEYGKAGSFEVRQELLDAFDYTPERSGPEHRKLTLRAGYAFSSILDFEEPAEGSPPVTVAGNEIRLLSR